MAKRIRRNFDDSFKIKIVLESLTEKKTLAHLTFHHLQLSLVL